MELQSLLPRLEKSLFRDQELIIILFNVSVHDSQPYINSGLITVLDVDFGFAADYLRHQIFLESG